MMGRDRQREQHNKFETQLYRVSTRGHQRGKEQIVRAENVNGKRAESRKSKGHIVPDSCKLKLKPGKSLYRALRLRYIGMNAGTPLTKIFLSSPIQLPVPHPSPELVPLHRTNVLYTTLSIKCNYSSLLRQILFTVSSSTSCLSSVTSLSHSYMMFLASVPLPSMASSQYALASIAM